MSWIGAAIGVGVGGLLSYEKNKVAQNNEKQQMLANAAQDKYAPWTGAASSVKGPTVGSNTLAGIGGAMQGGLTGAMIGSQFSPSSAAPSAVSGAATGTNSLGGSDMSAQLGANANQFAANQANMAYMQPMAGQQVAQAPQLGNTFQTQASNANPYSLMGKKTFYP